MKGDESAVADFTGRFARNPKSGISDEPGLARIVMSKRRLVVAGDERTAVPLSDVVDLIVGNVPPDVRDLFDATITIGHRTANGTVETLLIEGGEETISKLRTVLFKYLPNGTKARVKHPARVGRRLTSSPP